MLLGIKAPVERLENVRPSACLFGLFSPPKCGLFYGSMARSELENVFYLVVLSKEYSTEDSLKQL